MKTLISVVNMETINSEVHSLRVQKYVEAWASLIKPHLVSIKRNPSQIIQIRRSLFAHMNPLARQS